MGWRWVLPALLVFGQAFESARARADDQDAWQTFFRTKVSELETTGAGRADEMRRYDAGGRLVYHESIDLSRKPPLRAVFTVSADRRTEKCDTYEGARLVSSSTELFGRGEALVSRTFEWASHPGSTLDRRVVSVFRGAKMLESDYVLASKTGKP
ncbi:MAG: hypothetical protein HY075_03675, partial [Deltaproteobacteria bacterium]|nr:hypothetical protein [Deltaproteobacteria bacterium]